MKLEPHEIEQKINSIAPEDQDMYRIGAQQSLLSTVMRTQDGANEVRNMLGTPAKREQIQKLFNDPDALSTFATAMGLENRMFQTKNIAGGSRTTQSIADLQNQVGLGDGVKNGVDVATKLANNNIIGLVSKFAQPLLSRATGDVTGKALSSVARLGFNPNLQQNLETLNRFSGVEKAPMMSMPEMAARSFINSSIVNGMVPRPPDQDNGLTGLTPQP